MLFLSQKRDVARFLASASLNDVPSPSAEGLMGGGGVSGGAIESGERKLRISRISEERCWREKKAPRWRGI